VAKASTNSSRKPIVRRSRSQPVSRKEQAVQTRLKLKEATAALLERVGYRRMRIADVAAEAGVAVGLFYHYFPDIKAITCEVLSDFMNDMTLAARNIPRGDDLFDTLRAQYRLLIDHFERHPGLMRCMIQVSDEVPEFGEIWKSSNRQWTNSFARYLADQIGPHAPDEDTVVLMAYCLGSMSDGLMHEYYVQRNPDLISRVKSKNELAEILAALTYRAVFLADAPAEKRIAASSSRSTSKARARRA
jgi:TetR/AcrR family transcriptional regulator, ethionamide resistance regulator